MRLASKLSCMMSITLILFFIAGCAIEQPESGENSEAAAQNDTAETNETENVTDPEPTETAVSQSAPTEEMPAYTAVFEEASCQFDTLPGYSPRCGYLIVPEDRTQPDGNEVRLHVAIFPSESDSPAPDPIIYLEGGPGGDALERLAFFFEEDFAPFLTDRDFIMFDQRGTGFSEPSLACEEFTQVTLDTLDEELSDEEATAVTLDALDACQQRLQADGINLAAYNSAENAADLNDLRIALGYDEWNLYGISYGTRLALVNMRDHPEGIRSVILDSAFPPQVNLTTDFPASTDRAFRALFDGCANSEACNDAYPNLEERFYDLVDSLEANPAKLQATDFFKAQTYDALVDGDGLFNIVFQGLYSEQIIPLLPKLIADTEQGEYTLLGLLISNDISTQDLFSIGMYFSVLCREEIAFESVAEVETAVDNVPNLAQFFEDRDANFEICAIWPSGEADQIESLAISSDIPTLVLAGEYDPITPPAWGALTAVTLPNSIYLEFPGVGHAVSTSGECPLNIAKAFVNNPTASVDSSCIASMTPPNFQTPTTVNSNPINLVDFEADSGFGAIIGVRPDGWEEQFTGVYARASNALDQTALMQIGAPGVPADTFLDLVTQQIGLEGELEDVGELEDTNGRIWQNLEGELQGLALTIAVTTDDGTTFIVLLIAENLEKDALLEALFMPALNAIQTKE